MHKSQGARIRAERRRRDATKALRGEEGGFLINAGESACLL